MYSCLSTKNEHVYSQILLSHQGSLICLILYEHFDINMLSDIINTLQMYGGCLAIVFFLPKAKILEVQRYILGWKTRIPIHI